ncbi:MAG: alpha-L-rhamnosidase, partial [Oxalobacteraceae bacterium]
AMWKGTADAMAQMAAATGRVEAAKRYAELAAAITKAFGHAFVRAGGVVGNGSQAGYILALQFNLVAEEAGTQAARRLADDIIRRGTLLSTGFLGTPYSLDVLADAGQHKLVYDLLLRTSYPSWGYMIAHQATTIWERWNGDVGSRVMNSFNHYALGAVAGFMFRRIAGIDPVDPGFSRFRFDPVYDRRMPRGGGRYESRVGLIATQWERGDDEFSVDIIVPANSRCTLHLPTSSIDRVREGERAIARDKSFTLVDHSKRLVLDLNSGRYVFRVSQPDYSG